MTLVFWHPATAQHRFDPLRPRSKIGNDELAIQGRGGESPGFAVEVTDGPLSIAAIIKPEGCVRTAKLDRSAEIFVGVIVFWKLAGVPGPMIVQRNAAVICDVLPSLWKPGASGRHAKLFRQMPRTRSLGAVFLWHTGEGSLWLLARVNSSCRTNPRVTAANVAG